MAHSVFLIHVSEALHTVQHGVYASALHCGPAKHPNLDQPSEFGEDGRSCQVMGRLHLKRPSPGVPGARIDVKGPKHCETMENARKRCTSADATCVES